MSAFLYAVTAELGTKMVAAQELKLAPFNLAGVVDLSVILFKLVHSPNTSLPNSVIVVGMVKKVKLVQLEKRL